MLPQSLQATPFLPDDPYFFSDLAGGVEGQWYLDRQTSGASVDVNARGAWDAGYTGAGVVIGFVEGAIQWEHPDLVGNFNAGLSYDFIGNAALPASSAELIADDHTTAVAGVAVAEGSNGQGISGLAPNASFASLYVLESNRGNIQTAYDSDTDMLAASAAGYLPGSIDIKNYSWSPTSVFGYSAYPQFEAGIVSSAAAGTIHVMAAGNSRRLHGINRVALPADRVSFGTASAAIDADISKRTLSRLPEVINVGAVGPDGLFADYSNFGANLFVTAPSAKGAGSGLKVLTTDLIGDSEGSNQAGSSESVPDAFSDTDYTSVFGGTSSSAPLVSAALALAKEAQPNLDTRFAKHLLAKTSTVIDATDASATGGWVTNSAGYQFNSNYGFGLLDTTALVEQALIHSGVTPLAEVEVETTSVSQIVPANDQAGVSRTFTVTETGPLEEVIVQLRVAGRDPFSGDVGDSLFARGDIEAWLTSPAGTQSRLMYRNAQEFIFNEFLAPGYVGIDWPYLTNAFWGEEMSGEWTLTVYDVDDGGDTDGVIETFWQDFGVTFRSGELVAETPDSGDFDLDGDVDGQDFLVWQREDGTAPTLQDWITNYSSNSPLAAATIPEPSSVTLIVGSLALMLLRRKV